MTSCYHERPQDVGSEGMGYRVQGLRINLCSRQKSGIGIVVENSSMKGHCLTCLMHRMPSSQNASDQHLMLSQFLYLCFGVKYIFSTNSTVS